MSCSLFPAQLIPIISVAIIPHTCKLSSVLDDHYHAAGQKHDDNNNIVIIMQHEINLKSVHVIAIASDNYY